MNKIYVGTSLYNGDKAKHFISRFKDLGMAITYDWTTHGKVETVEELTLYGEAEFKGVADCDIFFMLTPARTGTHVELGIALALGKLIVIVFTEAVEMKTFYYLPNVHKFTTEEEAFNFVTERCK